MSRKFTLLSVVLLLLLIQACSGNGFHLRKSVELTPQFSSTYLKGLSSKNEFSKTFTDALTEAGGSVVESSDQSKVVVNFSRFEEGRRVIAYTSDRRAREYLVFLKVEYSIQNNNNKSVSVPKHRLNIDRSYLYDPDFALGKSEEEKRVKQTLYEEVTRLILLRLKYSQ